RVGCDGHGTGYGRRQIEWCGIEHGDVLRTEIVRHRVRLDAAKTTERRAVHVAEVRRRRRRAANGHCQRAPWFLSRHPGALLFRRLEREYSGVESRFEQAPDSVDIVRIDPPGLHLFNRESIGAGVGVADDVPCVELAASGIQRQPCVAGGVERWEELRK